jgi:beta-galactosidase GanA
MLKRSSVLKVSPSSGTLGSRAFRNAASVLQVAQMRACAAVVCLGVALSARAAESPPGSHAPAARLVTTGGRTRLEVNGRALFMRGGELANSSAASLSDIRAAFAKLPRLGLNTVLVPVSWELVEPEEGKFDFALPGGAIREARRNRLQVVLLWFGSWKNGMSSYVPAWVKRDQKRFPRAELAGGRGAEALSAFSAASRDADARAFAALLRYVRTLDGRTGTVVMIQVENEVGMIGEAADRSAAAAAAFRAPVPPEVPRPAGTKPAAAGASWEEVFGKGAATEERFQAWAFARYVDAVAQAGKAEYPLPMYVNAALNAPGAPPGKYPSAGPLPHLLDVWKAGAPTVEVMAPDIYTPAFSVWSERYRRADNPLFIPEAKNGEEVGVHALYAAGQQALGFSPFAIDQLAEAPAAALAHAYALIGSLDPLLSAAGPNRTAGVLVDKETAPVKVTLGGFTLTFVHDYTFPWASPARENPVWPRAGGLAIALGDDEFLVAGNGLIVTFAPATPGDPVAGIERVDEGLVENGRFVVTRRLNGDETHQGRQLRLPMGTFGLQRVKLYRYR